MRIAAVVCLVALLCGSSGEVQADTDPAGWSLPLKISDANTTVRFEVDSTWHLVKGTTSGINGEVTLSNPDELGSIRALLSLPVKSFSTNSSRRDRRMREVMHADQHPNVEFQSSGLTDNCSPAVVAKLGSCSDTLKGSLTISGTTASVALPVTFTRGPGSGILAQGSIALRWAEFGIEDPSIIVANLYPVVTVFFEVKIEQQPSAGDHQQE